MKPDIEAVVEEVCDFLKPFAGYLRPGDGIRVLRKMTMDQAAIAYGGDASPLEPRLAGEGLVRAARDGCALSDEALRSWAKKLILSDQCLPPELANYIADGPLSNDWSRPKASRAGNIPRNVVFLQALDLAQKRLGRGPKTRTDATKKEAPTSIVRMAAERVGYHITEAALKQIWRDRMTAGQRLSENRPPKDTNLKSV